MRQPAAVTGSSSAVGFYSILLRATDASGQSTDRTLSVRVRAAATTAAQPAGSDQPSAWRPADTSGLRSYLYYDGQGRVVGAVDEQQFLTETVYDDALNTQQTLRYLVPVDGRARRHAGFVEEPRGRRSPDLARPIRRLRPGARESPGSTARR